MPPETDSTRTDPALRALQMLHLREAIASTLPNSDLVHLALANTAFEEPALRYLWRHLTHLRDLLGVFPADVLTVNQAADGLELAFHRQMTEEDWTRFDFYAGFVRTMDLGSREHRLSSGAAGTLLLSHQLRCRPSLLPNLQSLNCGYLSNADNALYLLLLGPQLRSLTLQLSNGGNFDSGPFFLSLRFQSPYVSTLRLGSWAEGGIAELLHGLSKLETVSLRGWRNKDIDLVTVLQGLENLRSLDIAGSSMEELDDTTFQPLCTIESACERASPTHMHLPGSWCIPSILTPSFAGHRLVTLSVRVMIPRPELPVELRRIFKEIGKACTQLTHLAFLVPKHRQTPPSAGEGTSHTSIIPVVALLNLRRLKFFRLQDQTDSVQPSWEGCRALLPSAWENMQSLVWITAARDCMGSLAILGLFSGCPFLSMLSLPLDAAVAFDPLELSPFRRPVGICVTQWAAVSPDAVDVVAKALVKIQAGRRVHQIVGLAESSRCVWADVEARVASLLDSNLEHLLIDSNLV